MNIAGTSPQVPSLAALRATFKGLRVVGDVHGDAHGFSAALAGARDKHLFTVQLGDLTDRGSDSAATLRMALEMVAEHQGIFLLGNHDHKLRRALSGALVRPDPEGLGVTLKQIAAAPDADALRQAALDIIGRAPAWLRLGPWLFVHGGFHPRMLREPPPPHAGSSKPEGLVPRALFGQVTSRTRIDGYPERLHNWVHRIPSGITVYCGHETRSADGRPYVAVAAAGGRAVFLDTGAGKGGHLSWIDLPW